jgi:hypothetical protein
MPRAWVAAVRQLLLLVAIFQQRVLIDEKTCNSWDLEVVQVHLHRTLIMMAGGSRSIRALDITQESGHFLPIFFSFFFDESDT